MIRLAIILAVAFLVLAGGVFAFRHTQRERVSVTPNAARFESVVLDFIDAEILALAAPMPRQKGQGL